MGRRARRQQREQLAVAQAKAKPKAAEKTKAPSGPPKVGDNLSTRTRPQAVWGAFPLSELTVALAIVIGIVGFITKGTGGAILMATAAVLGSLAGLELALREHLAGYRSHTTLLAGLAAMIVIAMGFLVIGGRGTVVTLARLVPAIAVFAVAFFLLRKAFKRRSGGLGFR